MSFLDQTIQEKILQALCWKSVLNIYCSDSEFLKVELTSKRWLRYRWSSCELSLDKILFIDAQKKVTVKVREMEGPLNKWKLKYFFNSAEVLKGFSFYPDVHWKCMQKEKAFQLDNSTVAKITRNLFQVSLRKISRTFLTIEELHFCNRITG